MSYDWQFLNGAAISDSLKAVKFAPQARQLNDLYGSSKPTQIRFLIGYSFALSFVFLFQQALYS